MKWMEALSAMKEHSHRIPTTFYTFINKTSAGSITDIFVCRGFPHYKMSDEGVVISFRNANKNERIFVFEGLPHENDWVWYPDSLVLLRIDSANLPQNITHEELFGIGNTAL